MTRKRRNKLTGIILLCLVLLLGIVTGGSLYLIQFALTPSEKKTAKDLRTDKEMYTAYPFIKPWVDSLRLHKALKDTFITNTEGVRLHALYAQAPRHTSHTAVIIHGYTDSARRMLMIGYLYHHDLGYNILLPDLQYHGKSGGQAIQMGWKDRLDVLRWMAVADTLFGGHTHQVVHGISMGAATTMMVSGEKESYARCFVEDCGYTSAWDEFGYELQSMFGLPKFPLLYTASALCKLRYGWSFGEASALKQVAKCHKPMLFIHGGNDTYVPTRMVYPLYQAKPSPKELWIVPGVEHALSYKTHRVEYTRRVKEFTRKYIR